MPGDVTPRLKVLLVEDHETVRAGLRLIIDGQTDMAVVGEVADGSIALSDARALQPDVVVMDVSMPDGDGIRATAKIRSECPAVRILGLSRHLDPGYVRRFLSAGASGYVVKRATAVELVQAVRAVAAGATYIDAAVATPLADNTPDALRGDIGGTPLTARETEVLRLIARGRSNRDIAATLSISIKTVEYHKARCAAKLGLRGRADIVRYAIRQGWMEE